MPTTIVEKICPSGTTLQPNGLCGVGNTFPVPSGDYCGPQYNGKDCKYLKQVTPGLTSATQTESTNMVCAFQDGDAQFPCDPGCCTSGTIGTSGTGAKDGTSGTGETSTFPIWAIILLIVLGAVLFLAFVVKKMSRRSSNGR